MNKNESVTCMSNIYDFRQKKKKKMKSQFFEIIILSVLALLEHAVPPIRFTENTDLNFLF